MPAFDEAPERPEHIDQILNGLDRYNPQTTQVFQDYVASQCDNQTCDSYANLALLKLYVRFLDDTHDPLTSPDDSNLPQRFLLSDERIRSMKLTILALSDMTYRNASGKSFTRFYTNVYAPDTNSIHTFQTMRRSRLSSSNHSRYFPPQTSHCAYTFYNPQYW